MKRKSLQGSVCAVARALDVIGDWWSLVDHLRGDRRPETIWRTRKNLGCREKYPRDTAQGAFSGGNRPSSRRQGGFIVLSF